MEFEYMKWRKRKAQEYDKDNITLTKAGKTFNVYDKIQEGRADTEIYPTLEKYGCIDRMITDTSKIMAEFEEYKDLRLLKDQQIKAEQMFYDLPLEFRQKFNNDISTFIKDGEKTIKKMIAEEMKANEIKEPTTEVTNE